MMLQPVVLNLPTPDTTPNPVAGNQFHGTFDAEDSLLTRLVARAEAAQDVSGTDLKADLDQIVSGRMSTVDLLRLQTDMTKLSVRVQMTVRVADDIGRAIQTLTQRS